MHDVFSQVKVSRKKKKISLLKCLNAQGSSSSRHTNWIHPGPLPSAAHKQCCHSLVPMQKPGTLLCVYSTWCPPHYHMCDLFSHPQLSPHRSQAKTELKFALKKWFMCLSMQSNSWLNFSSSWLIYTLCIKYVCIIIIPILILRITSKYYLQALNINSYKWTDFSVV